jgi:hypothetical protein
MKYINNDVISSNTTLLVILRCKDGLYVSFPDEGISHRSVLSETRGIQMSPPRKSQRGQIMDVTNDIEGIEMFGIEDK